MTPAILTVEQVAERLAVSVQTVRRWCEDGLIPARKIGRRWYVSERQLVAFVEQGQEVAR